jgi:hypothetical protein
MNGITFKGGHSVNEFNVTSSSAVTVNMPTIMSQVGYVALGIESDDGSIFSASTIEEPYISTDYRVVINLEKPLWNDKFSYSTINNNEYKVTTTNETVVMDSGFLTFNNNKSTTIADYSMLQTFKTFSLYEANPTYVNFRILFNSGMTAGALIDFGLGIVATTALPTDGIYFRVSGTTMNAVINKNGLETTVIDIFTPTVNVVHDYLIAVNDSEVEFWVDDILRSRIIPPSYTGGTTLSNAMPLFIRHQIRSATANPTQIKVASINVLLGDLKQNKNWQTTLIGFGQNSISFPDNTPTIVTGTTSANLINNEAPTRVVLNNTTSGYAGKIGGNFQFSAITSSETDLILFSYLNPFGSTSSPAKSFIINSVSINSYLTGGTIITTNSVLQWAVGIGDTAESLLEVNSVTAGTRASSRLGLGMQSFAVGATTGAVATNPIFVNLTTPLMVEQGTYLHVMVKMPVHTAVDGIYIRCNVGINGYFE